MKTATLLSTADLPAQQVSALYIANPDGTPRWIWPAESREPVFLSFYPATTPKQKLFRWAIRLIFMLRLQRLVFSVAEVTRPVANDNAEWALFTGTVGPNRKQVLIRDQNTVVKIAGGPDSRKNLTNEAKILRRLERAPRPLPFAFPKVVSFDGEQLAIQRLDDRGTWNRITPQHTDALRALRTAYSHRAPLNHCPEWKAVGERLSALEKTNHPEISISLLVRLRNLAASVDGRCPINLGLAHGDFTPWNTLRTGAQQLAVIDWELARERMPAGYDYFHFHLQQGVMVERKSWEEIYTAMREGLTPLVKVAVLGSVEADVDFYLRLYLLHHLTYYLTVYARQEQWHQQIYWQMEVWTDALRSLAPTPVTRPEVIRGVLQTLAAGGYAVLKLGDRDPAELPADSDLDILVPRASVDVVADYLEGCRGVNRVHCVRKSFMASLAVVLTTGELLHLDLIWKLKRKATVIMDVLRLIERARVNAHGVPTVSESDTADYLRLFYGLNGQPIPAKYGVESGDLPALPGAENRGWSGLRNRLDYLVDTLTTAVRNRGFIVTFSGVDGAGKSTVIEQVTTLIDKQLRRPVKVLRHRPSVLPILSAYVHGKEGAEQRSVERLPRTGTNRNVLSSLLRFAYYYTDYFFGQAYVYARYVLRGYAVVYDRYYFDFMLDARRSNIEIPQWIPRWGLPLLLKPQFNFFLYADPDTILARKRELDRDTIVDLTGRYRSLFDDCQRRYPRRVFANVENIELDRTMARLSSTLKTSIR